MWPEELLYTVNPVGMKEIRFSKVHVIINSRIVYKMQSDISSMNSCQRNICDRLLHLTQPSYSRMSMCHCRIFEDVFWTKSLKKKWSDPWLIINKSFWFFCFYFGTQNSRESREKQTSFFCDVSYRWHFYFGNGSVCG